MKSAASPVREIDGTDERDCDQNKEGTQKSKDDHHNLLKNSEREMQVVRQRYVICFQFVTLPDEGKEVAKIGQLWASVHTNRVLDWGRPADSPSLSRSGSP